MREKTLDLTCFNRGTFAGVIRIRYIADWANDYWRNGYKLARIKLFPFEYQDLIRELTQDDMCIMDKLHDGTLSVDLGFGSIEIIKIEKNK